MTDRPILFSAPMVRALLDGTKTQTRRVLTPQPEQFDLPNGQPCIVGCIQVEGEKENRVTLQDDGGCGVITLQKVRYAIGDRLWVRENWFVDHVDCQDGPYRAPKGMTHEQLVDQAFLHFGATDDPRNWEAESPKWKPSIHMPRWASRLTLIVTDVRVQRLKDISEEDVLAEGAPLCPYHSDYTQDGSNPYMCTIEGRHGTQSPHAWFHRLWDSINGPEAWEANPWVVAVSFEVHQCNIDQLHQQMEAA